MTAMVIQSDRIGGRTVLVGTGTDIDGDQALSYEQPSTFGDCLLESIRVTVSGFATVAASLFELGVSANIVHTAPVDLADIVGNGKWHLIAGTFAAPTSASAFIEPLRAVLWRSGESLRISFDEVDTNGAPTADLIVQVRVLRLRAP